MVGAAVAAGLVGSLLLTCAVLLSCVVVLGAEVLEVVFGTQIPVSAASSEAATDINTMLAILGTSSQDYCHTGFPQLILLCGFEEIG